MLPNFKITKCFTVNNREYREIVLSANNSLSCNSFGTCKTAEATSGCVNQRLIKQTSAFQLNRGHIGLHLVLRH